MPFDLTQEHFISWLQGAIKADGSKVKTWLFTDLQTRWIFNIRSAKNCKYSPQVLFFFYFYFYLVLSVEIIFIKFRRNGPRNNAGPLARHWAMPSDLPRMHRRFLNRIRPIPITPPPFVFNLEDIPTGDRGNSGTFPSVLSHHAFRAAMAQLQQLIRQPTLPGFPPSRG